MAAEPTKPAAEPAQKAAAKASVALNPLKKLGRGVVRVVSFPALIFAGGVIGAGVGCYGGALVWKALGEETAARSKEVLKQIKPKVGVPSAPEVKIFPLAPVPAILETKPEEEKK